MGNLVLSCVLWGFGLRMPTVEGPFPAGAASTRLIWEFSSDSTSKIRETLLVKLSQQRAHLWLRDALLFMFVGLPSFIFFHFLFTLRNPSQSIYALQWGYFFHQFMASLRMFLWAICDEKPCLVTDPNKHSLRSSSAHSLSQVYTPVLFMLSDSMNWPNVWPIFLNISWHSWMRRFGTLTHTGAAVSKFKYCGQIKLWES